MSCQFRFKSSIKFTLETFYKENRIVFYFNFENNFSFENN